MITIADILSFLNDEKTEYEFIGSAETQITGFSSLNQYMTGNITWIKAEKNIPADFMLDKITLAIIQEGVNASAQNVIITSESKRAFFCIIEHFFNQNTDRAPVGYGTYIGKNVRLGNNVTIGHNCSLDGDITIGDNTVIWDNVTIINKVVIGQNCTIQSGVRIGHDGYGYTEDINHIKTMVKHFGGVLIEDNVFVGPNTIVYRGVIDDTIIRNGCKIAGLSNISHNVILENNVSIIAGTILYGSTKIGKNSYISTSILRNQISIGDNSFVGMGSVVTKDVPSDTTVVGVPAKPLIKENK